MQQIVVCSAMLAAWLTVSTASAQELSLDQALERARANAPRLTVARAVVAQSDAEVAGARVWRQNPRLDAAAGPRFAGTQTTVDVSVGLEQSIPLGPQRSREIAHARATRGAARADARQVEHETLTAVAAAFVDLLYWKQQRALAAENVALAAEIERVAQQRQAAGDVGALDVTLASLAQAGARSDASRIDASELVANGRLKALLGIDPQDAIVPTGDLASFGRAARIAARPDVAALEATLTATAAAQRAAQAQWFPGIAVGVEFAHEDDADVLLGVLSFTLPVFDRGQAGLARAVAAHERVQAELDQVVASAALDVVVAEQRVAKLDEAVAQFAATGLESATRAQAIAAASYAAGAMPLPELLSIRRELSAARADFNQLLLELAQARVELIANKGQW